MEYETLYEPNFIREYLTEITAPIYVENIKENPNYILRPFAGSMDDYVNISYANGRFTLTYSKYQGHYNVTTYKPNIDFAEKYINKLVEEGKPVSLLLDIVRNKIAYDMTNCKPVNPEYGFPDKSLATGTVIFIDTATDMLFRVNLWGNLTSLIKMNNYYRKELMPGVITINGADFICTYMGAGILGKYIKDNINSIGIITSGECPNLNWKSAKKLIDEVNATKLPLSPKVVNVALPPRSDNNTTTEIGKSIHINIEALLTLGTKDFKDMKEDEERCVDFVQATLPGVISIFVKKEDRKPYVLVNTNGFAEYSDTINEIKNKYKVVINDLISKRKRVFYPNMAPGSAWNAAE
jgi:hypothetical protein